MRRSLAFVLFVTIVVLSQSCSSELGEPISSSAAALAGSCGGTSIVATANSQGSHTFSPKADVLVPSSIAVVVQYPGSGTVDVTLALDSVSCSYSVAWPTYPVTRVDASFGSCTGGSATAGSDLLQVEQATLTVATTGSFATATAEIAQALDDGNPCTVDQCINGQPDHSSPVADGTIISASCAGNVYCSGGEATTAPAQPPPSDDCHSWTCDASGVWTSGPSTCSSPSLTGFTAATTLPTDFSGEMATVLANDGQPNGSLESKRLSILRGHVRTRAPDGGGSSPLQYVNVSVVGHSEFGWVLTRSDGGYDIVVNGGQSYVLQFSLANYLPVQRQATARWLDWTTLPDVALIAADTSTAKAVTLDGSEGWVAVQGATKTDDDGPRTASVLFQPGTTIQSCTGSDCGSLGASPLVHVTEYTVGNDGPSAMPGDLPPQSGYTYAFEAGFLSGNQPLDANVTFSLPALFYLEDFLQAPSDGTNAKNGVPSGSYDKTLGAWKQESGGKVYCIIDIQSGSARLSTDATCSTEVAYGSQSPPITVGEQQQIALLYPGATHKNVWRVPLPHFTSYDLNWGAGPPANAVPPPEDPPRTDQPNGHSPCNGGSIIECENQVLRESIPIVGTPYSLNYRSETQRGFHPTITVPVSTVDPNNAVTDLPPTLLRAEAEIQVAGQDVKLTLDDSSDPNWRNKPASLSWSWDRTDAYGNPVQGAVHAHVDVRYVYGSVPFVVGSFAEYNPYNTSTLSFAGDRSTREVSFTRSYDLVIGAFDDQPLGLGGWTISAHQVYQPTSATLFRGDGRKQDPNDSPEIVHSYFAGTGSTTIEDLAAAADGSIYILQSGGSFNLLGRIDNGALYEMTSATETWDGSDGAPIADVRVDDPTIGRNLVAEPSGSLLYSDLCRILRVVPVSYTDLRVYLVAGTHDDSCASTFAADGAVAKGTALKATRGLTEMADGSILFIESDGVTSRVRRIKPDGTLETFVGGGATDIATCTVLSPCNPSSASLTYDNSNYSVAARTDGVVFISGNWENRIWELDPRVGLVYSFAGDGTNANVGNGMAGATAALAAYNNLSTVTTGSGVEIAGSSASFLSVVGSALFFPSRGNDRTIREIGGDGTITGFAGTYLASSPYLDGLFATQTALIPKRLVLGPDGYYYTTADNSGWPNRIVRFRRGDDAVSGSDLLVPSDDGKEVYEVDATGKHLYTRSKYSGTTSLTVGYDPNNTGFVTALSGLDGTTTITGYVAGYGTGTVTISSPAAQPTILTITNGYLTDIEDPYHAHTQLTYDTNNRLATLTEPVAANVHHFYYSPTGLLVQDIAPAAGAGTRLTRTEDSASYSVDFSTAESRTTTHNVDMSSAVATFTDANGVSYNRREQRTQATLASSNATVDSWFTDSTHVDTGPDGMTTSVSLAPDPRFGMSLPYVTTRTMTTGSHNGNTGTKCQGGWNGMCERTTRTVSPIGCTGFSCTSVTDATYGSINEYNTTSPDMTVWTSAGTTDCLTPPCIVKTSSQGRKVVYNLGTDAWDADRVTGVTVGDLSSVSLGYGPSGQSRGKIISIAQGTRTYGINYDSGGFVGSIDTPLFGSPTHTIAFGNDADGRPTSEVFAGQVQRTVSIGYDDNGNRDSLELPKGSSYQHQFTFNSRNLLSSYEPPAIGYSNSTYDYDLDGLLSNVDPPTANLIANVRDAAGRVAQVTYAHPVSGTVTVAFSYDATTGQPCTGGGCSATNGPTATVTTVDSYDGALLESEHTTGPFDHTVNWTYDDSLLPKTRDIDGNESFTFAYDHDGLLASVAAGATTYAITRTATGAVQCASTGSVLCDVYGYDTYGAITDYSVYPGACSQSCTGSGTALYSVHYDRTDPVGRIHSKSESFGGGSACTHTYAYDPGGLGKIGTKLWLTSDQRTGSCNNSHTYSYDADGNDTAYQYDTQDRQTSTSGWTWAYTANGEVASQTGGSHVISYGYDPVGNLRHFNDNQNNVTFDYAIDSRNRRVYRASSGTNDSKANGTDSRGWIYEGDRIIGESTSNPNQLLSHFAYATKSNVPDLFYKYDGTWGLYRIVSDIQGTVREVVCISNCNGWSAGQVAETQNTYNYNDDWGAIWNPPQYQPFGFAGGLVDYVPGITRFGARDYTGWQRRWMSKDPIRFDGGLNLYAYCGNDPVNCVDPSGRFSLTLPLLIPELGAAGAEFGPVGIGVGIGIGIAVNVGIYIYDHPPVANSCPVTAEDLAVSPPPVASAGPYRNPAQPPPRDCGTEYAAAIAACDTLYTGYALLKCKSDAQAAYVKCLQETGQ